MGGAISNVSTAESCGFCGNGDEKPCFILNLWCIWNKIAPCYNRGDTKCVRGGQFGQDQGQCVCNTGSTCQIDGYFLVLQWKRCVSATSRTSPFLAWPEAPWFAR